RAGRALRPGDAERRRPDQPLHSGLRAPMARLYLIRHGKPSSTWSGDDDDPGLDETGQAQAKGGRDWLMKLPAGERISRVVSSPLRRCRETAQATADALGVKIEIDE